MNRKCLACMCCIVFSLTLLGCSSLEETWDKSFDFTKNTYKSYVNTDPCVDLDQDSGCSPDEIKIAQTFMPVDEALGKLIRVQSDKDTYPPDTWLDLVISEFGWLNGVMVVDLEGDQLAKRPSTTIKEPNLEDVLDPDLAWPQGTVRWFLQRNDLGPEFVLASPFFKDSERKGLVITHFDFRSLAGLSPQPQELIAFSPKTMLWAGKYDGMKSVFLAPDWNELLRDDVMGRIELEEGDFLWLSRYIGEQPLIYAVRCHLDEG